VVKLTLPTIKRVGDVEDTINFVAGGDATQNTYEYQGLIRYFPDTPSRVSTPGIDLLIVDLDTGYIIDSRSLQRAGTSTQAGVSDANGEIDYRSGTIHLRDDPGAQLPKWNPPFGISGPPVYLSPGGRHVRVYARTFNDFAVASAKPYESYLSQPNLSQIQPRQYYPGYGYGYLVFPNMDAGKTVTVDYVWQDTLGAMHTESGELHKIDGPGNSFGPTPGSTGQGQFDCKDFSWLRLAHGEADPSKSGGDAGVDASVKPGTLRVLAVRGASFQTRVVWREGGQYRHITRSTLLTRELTP
jgi:hypothetical protein